MVLLVTSFIHLNLLLMKNTHNYHPDLKTPFFFFCKLIEVKDLMYFELLLTVEGFSIAYSRHSTTGSPQ